MKRPDMFAVYARAREIPEDQMEFARSIWNAATELAWAGVLENPLLKSGEITGEKIDLSRLEFNIGDS